MENPELVNKKLAVFILLTLALSSIFYYLILSAGSIHAGHGFYTFGLMWCPGLAAFVTNLSFHRSLRGFGWHWRKTRYQVISYMLPFLYCTVVYGIIWLTGLGHFYNAEFVTHVSNRLFASLELGVLQPSTVIVMYILIMATLGVLASCLSAAGEEIGWRGFLVPNLAKVHSYTTTSIISGAIWAVWHFPLILFADYNGQAAVWFSLLCFTVMLLGLSFAFAWLRLKSDSLWTGVLLHASHNVFVQQVFSPLTATTDKADYFTGEFGLGLALIALLVAVLFWKRRNQLHED